MRTINEQQLRGGRFATRGIAALGASLLLVAVGLGCRPETPAGRLARELKGAFPERAAPTGTVRTFDIEAREAELALIDGGKLRVWAYNGSVPGPELRIRLGETLRVRFTNRLPQPTTIHWHGVRVPNAMDGVPHVTQPPVEPGGSFTYEFTPKDAGTFWFHPHVRSSEQVERGLYGVLVVEDRAPPPYTRDVVWVLDDWLLDETRQIFDRFNTMHDLMHDGRWGNVVTVNGRTNSVLEARGGELRLEADGFRLGQRAHLGVGLLLQRLLGLRHGLLQRLVALGDVEQVAELAVLLVERARFSGVRNHLRRGQELLDLGEAGALLLDFGDEVHRKSITQDMQNPASRGVRRRSYLAALATFLATRLAVRAFLPVALAPSAADRLNRSTFSRRASRLSLMVVRTYLCHSKPSAFFRRPNIVSSRSRHEVCCVDRRPARRRIALSLASEPILAGLRPSC